MMAAYNTCNTSLAMAVINLKLETLAKTALLRLVVRENAEVNDS
jgi:hypothetical protein